MLIQHVFASREAVKIVVSFSFVSSSLLVDANVDMTSSLIDTDTSGRVDRDLSPSGFCSVIS